MRNLFTCFCLLALLFPACQKEDLPPTEFVMIKFVNQTGKDIEELVVNRADVGLLKRGKTTETYYPFERLGQQFGYALVEAVGSVNGKKHYTASACQGVCGTPSAPKGVWLEPGYYKISIHLAPDEGNYLEFRMKE
jgi:hypothetical protein